MSTKIVLKSDVESMIEAGSVGLAGGSKSISQASLREQRSNLFTSSWVETTNDVVKVYTGPDCPLVFSNKFGSEVSKSFPDLSDRIITVNKITSSADDSNLMLTKSGILIVDKMGNIATIISNSAEENGKFSISGALNGRAYLRDTAVYSTLDQMAVIGIVSNGGTQKLIDINNDLDFEKLPPTEVKQYFCVDQKWEWEKTDTFKASILIKGKILYVTKVGFFNGVMTHCFDASKWGRNGAITHLSQITEENSSIELFKAIYDIKKVFGDTKTIRVLTNC